MVDALELDTNGSFKDLRQSIFAVSGRVSPAWKDHAACLNTRAGV